MDAPESATRTLRRALLGVGVIASLAAVARGLSTGKLFVPGSNNLLIFIAGLVLAGCAWALGHPRLTRATNNTLAEWARRSTGTLAGLSRHPIFYLTLGIWLGVVLGVAESAYRLYHGPTVFWRHALWLGPVTYGAAFGLIGLGLTLTARLTSNVRAHLRFAVWLQLTMCAAGFLLLALPQVHPLAIVVLAAGLAVQLSGLAVRQAYAAGLLMRTSAWVAGCAVVVIVGWAFRADGLESGSRAAAVAPPAGARNALLIVLDTVRAESLSLLGYQRGTTPELERWARQGILFESAMTTAPWTLPSHAGMFTGRWAHELGARRIETFDATYPTIAEVMNAAGYATAGFVANLVYTTRKTGLARGFQHYEDFRISLGDAIQSTSLGRTLTSADWIRNVLQQHQLVNRKPASEVNAAFLSWLDRQDRGPFFAFLNYFDAHAPYDPARAFADRFRTAPPIHRGPFLHFPNHAGPVDWWQLTPEQVTQERDLYEAAIATQDREIGRLLQALDERDILKDTIVIVTSDHGEHFGEHGVFNHGNNLYLPQLHVPLLMLVPGLSSPVRVAESVSLRDIPNTVLDLTGVSTHVSFPGASLTRFWNSDGETPALEEPMYISLYPSPSGEHQPAAPLSRGVMRAVIDDPYHYILNGDGTEELFNYRADPRESRNLAGLAEAEPHRHRFRDLVVAADLP